MWRDVDDGKLDGFTLTKVPPFEGMKSYPAIRFADPDSDTGWSVVYGYDEDTRLWLRSKLLGSKSMSGYRLTFLPADEAPSPGLTIDGQCVRVIDGDTIVVETKTQYHVRLLNCWAPESRTKDSEEKQRGMASKNRLIELAGGKRVRVSIPLSGELGDSITMGRVLGRAWLDDGRELSTLMVAEGLATEKKVKKPQ
jgi:endonuclease YncB( thermonuclease family)